MDVILQNHTLYDEAVIEYYYQNLKYENKNGKRELADLSRHFIIIEVFIGIVVCTLIGSDKWIYSIPLIAITFIFLYYWTISYTKKIFLKLDSNYSYKRYKEKVTYNFYDDKLEIIRKYDRTIIEWKNITCCNIKKNLCWLGYGNKGLTELQLPLETVTELPPLAKELNFTIENYKYCEMPKKKEDILTIKLLTGAGEIQGIRFESKDNGETWAYAGISVE